MQLTEEQLRARLLKNATLGALVNNWTKHPAYKLFEEAIQSVLDDRKNTWLTGTDEEARNARAEAKGVMKALAILRMFKNAGMVAKEGLKETNDLGTPSN